MLGVGIYFMTRNKNIDDYFVGGRKMSAGHVGLSVVATDVGGGFSIGLGGLGFAIGLSGSWMLFTGLIGAWLSAYFLIPQVFKYREKYLLYTFPQLFEKIFSPKVALVATLISAVGYLGFTAAQILAGAKLAVAAFPALDLSTAIWLMGLTAVVYTVFGGLKAVIYTDTFQWLLLMGGLIFIGIPMAYHQVGGWAAISETLAPEFLRLDNLGFADILNWAITIIPIWFIGMTLYQRIYACKDEKTAKKAWFIAGIFEWPIMAFMGVALGLLARVAFTQGLLQYTGDNIAAFDVEMGLPFLLRDILPLGLMGLMMSAYFSAIMSTADSCLMAASGNVLSDFLMKIFPYTEKKLLRLSQWVTLLIGLLALLIASQMTEVLDLMLLSYSFMVSGLFIPLLAALFFPKKSPQAAFWSILIGGTTTLSIELISRSMGLSLPAGIDANAYGIAFSLITYLSIAHYGFRNTSPSTS